MAQASTIRCRGVEIELRPIFEAEDFGEELTPDLREANERLRGEAARN